MADESFNLVAITFTKCAELVRLDNDYNKSISLISHLKKKLKEKLQSLKGSISDIKCHNRDACRYILTMYNS